MGTRREAQAKAARTRAENAERERQEGAHLATQTEGGRVAKHRALQNAVWKKDGPTRVGKRRYNNRKVVEDDPTSHDELRNPSDIEPNDLPVKTTNYKVKSKSTRTPDSDDDPDDSASQSSDYSSESDEDEVEDDGVLGPDFVDELPQIIDKGSHRGHKALPPVEQLFNLSDNDVEIATAQSRLTSSRQPPDTSSDEENTGLSKKADVKARREAKAGVNRVTHAPEQPRSKEVNFPNEANLSLSLLEKKNAKVGRQKVQALDTEAHKRRRLDSDSSDEENISPPAILPRKKAKLKSRREEAFEAERPRVNLAGNRKTDTRIKAKHFPAVGHRTDWSPEVQLEPIAVSKGTKRKLKEQSFVLQAIIRRAIEQATDHILLKKNWPEENNRTAYGKELILNGCRDGDITRTYDTAAEVKLRIKTDCDFAKGLGDLVVDRLSAIRKSAKAEASKLLPSYQLGLGDNCRNRVESLLNNLRFHSVGHWGDSNEWVPEPKGSFKHPALIGTIRAAYFSNSRSAGYRYIDQFLSSIAAKPEEKEIPIALLALNLTGLYSCLYEFRSGKKEDLDFDGATFRTINQTLTNILERLKHDRPLEFHERLHDIFNLVVGSSSSATRTEDIESSAISIIDF